MSSEKGSKDPRLYKGSSTESLKTVGGISFTLPGLCEGPRDQTWTQTKTNRPLPHKEASCVASKVLPVKSARQLP